MTSARDRAFRLRAQAEQWQDLVARQLDLTVNLRQLVSQQRELVALWSASDAEDLTTQAEAIENSLRDAARLLVQFELAAAEKIAETIAVGSDELRQAKDLQSRAQSSSAHGTDQ